MYASVDARRIYTLVHVSAHVHALCARIVKGSYVCSHGSQAARQTYKLLKSAYSWHIKHSHTNVSWHTLSFDLFYFVLVILLERKS